MTDDPSVEAVQDGNEKDQWGKRFLFFKEGRKSSLNHKKALIVLGGIFGLFGLFQIVGGNPDPASDERDSISPPPTNSSNVSVDFAAIESSASPLHDRPKAGRKRRTSAVKYYGPQLVARPRDLGKIPPGSFVNAVLEGGASNGPVRARLSDGLTVNGASVIEPGAVLVGEGSSSEERLFITFTQVVFRDGTFGSINAHACDAEDKIPGLKGSKIGNKALNIAGSIGLGFLGGMAQGLQDSRSDGSKTQSLKNALLNGTAYTAMEQSVGLMSDLKSRKPIIEIQPGTPICAVFGNSN